MKFINRRYRIDGEIGQGAYGVIYKVTDLWAGRKNPKILKIFNTDKLGNQDLEGFKNEYFYTKNIDIPCAVKTYSFEKIYNIDGFSFYGNYYFYTMNFVRGEKISTFSASSKKDRKILAEKILFSLKWLHANGYGHGDLHPDNILLDENDQIVFLDFIQPKNIELNKENLTDFVMEITGIKLDPDKESFRHVTPKSVFEILKKNYKLNMGTLRYVRKTFDTAFNRSEKDKGRCFRINAVNYKKSYYDIVKDYFKSYAEIHDFFFIDLDLSKDPLAYFSEFREQMIKSLDLRGIKSSEITKDEAILNGESKALEHILSSVVKLSYYGKVAMSIEGDDCDQKITNAVDRIMRGFNGENLLMFTCVPTKSDQESHSYDVFDPPDKDEYADEISGKIKDLFYNIDTGNLTDYMRKNGNYDLCGVLERVLKSPGGMDRNGKLLILGNRIRKHLNDEYNGKFLSVKKQKEYEEFFAFFDLLIKPANISLLKMFLSESSEKNTERVIGELLNSGIVSRNSPNSLNYFDENTENRVGSIIRNSELKKRAAERIIEFLEGKELTVEEEKLLLSLYLSSGLINKYASYLYHNFIEPFRTSTNLAKITGDFFEKINIRSKLKESDIKDPVLKEAVEYAQIKTANQVDIVERNRKLNNFILKRKPSKIILIYVYFDFFNQFLNAGDMQNSNTFYTKILQEKEYFNEFQKLAFLIYEAKFFILNSDFLKALYDLRIFFKQIVNKKHRKYAYLHLNALETLSDCYHNGGQMIKFVNTLKIYMVKAEEISTVSKDFSYLFSSNTNFAFYHYKYGNPQIAKKHFQIALDIAKKNGDYNDLILACNNLAAIENDTIMTLAYLKDALKYSKLLGENIYIYLVLSNILSLNIEPLEKYKFLEQNYSLVKRCYKDHEISVKFCLNIFYSIISILLSLNKKDELVSFFDHLKKTEIEKNKMPDAYLFKKIVALFYEINVNGYKNEYYKMFYDILDEFKNINNYDLILYMYINDLFNLIDDRQIQFISKKLIASFKDKTTGDEINAIRIFVKLRSSKIDSKAIIRYIERYVSGISNRNYITYRLIFYLASAYKKTGNVEYKNLLSYTASELSFEMSQYSNKRFFKKTHYGKALEIFRKDFPSEYKLLIEKRKKIHFTKTDMNEVNSQLHLNYFSERETLLKKILSTLLETMNYDRGAFFSSLHSKSPELVVYRKKYYYSDDEMFFLDRIPLEKAGEININEIYDPNLSVKSYITIPVVNEFYYKRFMHHFVAKTKKSKSSLGRSALYERELLNGVLYLDKKNDLRTDYDMEYLGLLSFTISQYWNYSTAEKLFMRDGLTKLYLRNVFLNKLREMIHGEKDSVDKLTLIMVDIDNFKNVNDLLGHARGDYVLKKLAEIMKKKIRSSDILGRYGGEEFLIALPNTDIYNGKIVADKVREAVERSKILGDVMNLTVSCGVAEYPKDSNWIEELIEKTDKYLIKAKLLGKNSVISSLDE
ncbi:diguanylate cyclase [candidate division WOR-3 bacterium]|nr:diguanylate cyclase [candidate division WOR-3 bacterium]